MPLLSTVPWRLGKDSYCMAAAVLTAVALAYQFRSIGRLGSSADAIGCKQRSAILLMSVGDDEVDDVIECVSGAQAAADASSMDESSTMLEAFERRVLEDGGSTSIRERQIDALKKDAERAVGDAGAVINKALDLDGQAAQASSGGRRVAVGTGGVLETAGWRATVAFGLLIILLSVYAAATTDFGDGGTDAALCMGDVKLCTRQEIENSRIAEIAMKNNFR